VDDVDQSSDFISRRSPRRHYVRFGRDSGGKRRHYVRFGRNGDSDTAAKRSNRHYVRFGRDQPDQQSSSDEEKRAHYVRFGRGVELVGDNDGLNTADKRPYYVRFG